MAHQEEDQPLDPSPDGLEDRLTLREVSAPSEFSNVPGEEPSNKDLTPLYPDFHRSGPRESRANRPLIAGETTWFVGSAYRWRSSVLLHGWDCRAKNSPALFSRPFKTTGAHFNQTFEAGGRDCKTLRRFGVGSRDGAHGSTCSPRTGSF